MALHPGATPPVTVDVFGSWVTEMAPSNLPSGVSPDNQDVVFAPGTVGTRPALQKVFSTPFPAGGPSSLVPTIVYGKSFIAPDGTIRNLYMDSNGSLWVVNLTTSPGTRTLLLDSSPGSFCKSITAFGREYIAISDGLHGTEVPLQYDGTNLDRVTQDGPGTPPAVSMVIIPPVSMAAAGSPSVLTITSITSTGLVVYDDEPQPMLPGQPALPGGTVSFYTQIDVIVPSGASALTAGESVTIAGNTNAAFNVTVTIDIVVSDTEFIAAFLSSTLETGTGGTATPGGGGVTASRSANIVTMTTASAHQLSVGFRAQISGIPAAVVGTSISSIVINNEDKPGVATVTTSTAHGLVPGSYVSIKGVNGVGVGGAITATSRQGGIVTVTTTSAHGLTPGCSVTIAGVTDASFNVTVYVEQTPTPTTIVFTQADTTDATSSGGTLTLNWPILSTALPTYFEVLTSPSATSFEIQMNYSDGTWSSGSVTLAWDGTFYVSAVPSSTSFQYQQFGPDTTTSTVGTVTPTSQIAPGKHQVRLSYLTRQGYITKPSPPVTFMANGGQYLSISNVAIGPSNIVARILEFTGANGAYFYYIPVPGQVNGQVISTATQINDNTTTNVLLDFSDNTLYAAIGTSIPGNNTSAQIVLDGALGFASYASRLITYGQRNRVQNFLNLTFDGGSLPTLPLMPTGWDTSAAFGSGNAYLVAGRFGSAWKNAPPHSGTTWYPITQSAYQDSFGTPILQPNTQYKVRVWASTYSVNPGTTAVFEISSASTSFSATASVTSDQLTVAGAFIELIFSAKTPASIPSDMTFSYYTQSSGTDTPSITIDEISVIYSENPYLDSLAYASYTNNPESFDGLTGKLGTTTDSRKIMAFGSIRGTLNFLTRDPSGRLHETVDNAVTEPIGWTVSEVAANCGILSSFCLTVSQADDSSVSGGEEWLSWASESGVRIYGGGEPWKISQEIQPNWFDPLSENTTQINMDAALSVWAVNDPVERVMYFGLPIDNSAGIAVAGAPTLIYPLNYREMETAQQISYSPPFHPSLSGRLIATDNSRKWTRWNLQINGAARMYKTPGDFQTVFFGGNGLAPGQSGGYGNVYTLNPAKMTDDDYGVINSYYITAFLPSRDQEQQLQLNAGRKIVEFLSEDVNGYGNLITTLYSNALSNAWPLTCTRVLTVSPNSDMEWGGSSCQGQRIACKVNAVAITGTDASFSLQKLNMWFEKARVTVRGAAK